MAIVSDSISLCISPTVIRNALVLSFVWLLQCLSLFSHLLYDKNWFMVIISIALMDVWPLKALLLSGFKLVSYFKSCYFLLSCTLTVTFFYSKIWFNLMIIFKIYLSSNGAVFGIISIERRPFVSETTKLRSIKSHISCKCFLILRVSGASLVQGVGFRTQYWGYHLAHNVFLVSPILSLSVVFMLMNAFADYLLHTMERKNFLRTFIKICCRS